MHRQDLARCSPDLFGPDVERLPALASLILVYTPVSSDVRNDFYLLAVRERQDRRIERITVSSQLNVKSAGEKEGTQGQSPGEYRPAAREIRRSRHETHQGHEPPKIGPPLVSANHDAEGVGDCSPEHGLA